MFYGLVIILVGTMHQGGGGILPYIFGGGDGSLSGMAPEIA
jgi:hypothetical protein